MDTRLDLAKYNGLAELTLSANVLIYGYVLDVTSGNLRLNRGAAAIWRVSLVTWVVTLSGLALILWAISLR
jgi:hypothetical protein